MIKKLLISKLIFLIPFLVVSSQYKGDKCIVGSEFIFSVADVTFPSCHASTIIQNGKELIAAWFGGTAERNPDVGIWVSRYTDGKWIKPVEVADGVQNDSTRYPCWNPVLYNTGKEVLLFYKVGPSPSEWWGELKTSSDGGRTWSHAGHLPEGIIGPVKDKPVLLKGGILLCPSSTENDGWRVHMEFTSDHCITWERTAALNDKSIEIIQPTALIYPSGEIRILCRSRQSQILTSVSEDDGHTWSSFTSSGLPNPNSGIDALTLADGRYLVVYNHLTSGRNMLNVAISDDGKNWKAAVLLENDQKGAEFSYPAIIQLDDMMVHITYTWNRKQIKHVIIDPAKIIPVPFLNGSWPDGSVINTTCLTAEGSEEQLIKQQE
jgi:predicted neuraminidase